MLTQVVVPPTHTALPLNIPVNEVIFIKVIVQNVWYLSQS